MRKILFFTVGLLFVSCSFAPQLGSSSLDEVISNMTNEEKVKLLVGTGMAGREENTDEAIEHINRYGTKHSECIVTRNYANARKFQQMVDAACVYANASTRFTDGFQFGFGAEIGISTQKLHARGPMALPELTTYKYLISGDGQVRP